MYVCTYYSVCKYLGCMACVHDCMCYVCVCVCLCMYVCICVCEGVFLRIYVLVYVCNVFVVMCSCKIFVA